MTNAIKSRSSLLIPLLLSLAFFLRKGLQYALIGSYLQLLVIAIMIGLFALAWQRSERKFRLIAKVWALLLIAWSLVRLLFSVMQLWVKPLKEYHLSQQFGYLGLGLSVLMLVAGVLIIRNSKFHGNA